MFSELKITKTTNSRLASVEFDSLGFGNVFSDHMFSLHYENGAWQRPEILPYGTIEMEPGTCHLALRTIGIRRSQSLPEPG